MNNLFTVVNIHTSFMFTKANQRNSYTCTKHYWTILLTKDVWYCCKFKVTLHLFHSLDCERKCADSLTVSKSQVLHVCCTKLMTTICNVHMFKYIKDVTVPLNICAQCLNKLLLIFYMMQMFECMWTKIVVLHTWMS